MPGTRAILSTTPLVLIAGLWTVAYFQHSWQFGVFGVFPVPHFVLYVILTLMGLAMAYVIVGHDRQTRRTRLCQVTAMTLSAFSCAALLEAPAALKLVDYRGVLNHNEGWDPVQNRTDPELISIHRPGGRLRGQCTGSYAHTLGTRTGILYDLDVRYDRNGFRNAQEMEAAEVVVVGDSFVESPHVAYEEIATSSLGREFGIPVLNLGQSGYGPQQELIVLKRYGLPARPKVVAWFFYEGSDLGDYLNYEKITSEGVSNWAATQDSFVRRSFARNLLNYLDQHCRRQEQFRVVAQPRQTTLTPPGEYNGKTMYFSHSRDKLDPDEARALAGTQQCILGARQACAEHDARFLLVFVPHSFRVYRDLVRPGPGSIVGQWQVDDLPDQLLRWARAQEIPFLDLVPALHRAARDGTLVYFLDDIHWTAGGNQVAADEVAAFCHREGWLTSGPNKDRRDGAKRPVDESGRSPKAF